MQNNNGKDLTLWRQSGELDQEPALGAHLETCRFVYRHHGLYVGAGTVVHYSGFGSTWRSGSVKEVTLSEFAMGHPIRIVDHPNSAYSPQEVVDRARSRIGEDNYHLLTNNCEHFCTWCVYGLSRSAQVEGPLARAFCTLSRAARVLRGAPPTLAGSITPIWTSP